jgi:uncharacterized membrane protein
MTLIFEDNIFALGTVLFGLAWFGFWIDSKPIGKKIAGVVWVISAAMLLSNFHIIPFKSAAYDFVGATLVPLAIPMLLFKADIRRIFRESGKIIFIFSIAVIGTILGAVLGFYLFDLGEMGAKVAGVYTGGWIGGAVNFVSVSQAVEMTKEEFSITLAAGSQVSNLALLMLILVSSTPWIIRMVPSTIMKEMEGSSQLEMEDSTLPTFSLTHVTGTVAISFSICALSQHLAVLLSWTQYSILIITILAIAIANLFPNFMNEINGDFELGMMLMYIFFASVGAATNAASFIGQAVNLFFYGLFIIVFHLSLVICFAKLLKIDLAEAIVGSGAALVGPAVTAAIASARGWRNLVTPAIMCGIFGYAIGTFIGVAVTNFLG